MLSIRFDPKREWWVSGEAFTRLFNGALRDGMMPVRLAEWLDIADANGGLDLSQLAPEDRDELVGALRSTAERDVERLKDTKPATPDGSYRISLQKFLSLEHVNR